MKKIRFSKLTQLMEFDANLLLENSSHLFENSLRVVLGVDEVGRGSLIGPVVAGALIFPDSLDDESLEALTELDDSKATHLNHEKRVAIATSLKRVCQWGIGEASKEEIETINIKNASLLASWRAVEDLKLRFPECIPGEMLVVIDGKFKIPDLQASQLALVKADTQSAAVAGASIIAKSYRDSLLIELAKDYPGYQWESNAGYPTPSHQEALRTLGVTPLHRKTYKTVSDTQLSLF